MIEIMKHWMLIAAFFISFIGCQKPEEIIFSDEGGTPTTRSITPNVSPVFDWWDTTSVALPGVDIPVTLPWYNGSSTQIPYYMLDDYKPEDGWEMVYNYCLDASPGEINKNHIIFYNKFRGILRVYYYNSNDVIAANQTFWRFEVIGSTSLFNALGQIALPMSERVNNPEVYVTNLTNLPSKAIARGWNCFDIELAYDEQLSQSNAHFNIGLYNMTEGTIGLEGDIELETEGTIVTHTFSSPNWIGDASKAVGDEAKSYVEKKLKGTSLEDDIANRIKGGVQSLVSSGAKFLLGALVGKKESSYNSTVQLTTTGDITLGGEFQVLTTSNALPLANNLMPGCIPDSDDSVLPAYDEPLGVWSLEETPTLYISPVQMWRLCELISYDKEMGIYVGDVQQESLVYFYPDSIKVNINPAVLNLIEKYEVDAECVWMLETTMQGDYALLDNTASGPRGDATFYTDSTVFVASTGLPPIRGEQASMRQGKLGFTYCSFHCVPMTPVEYNLLRAGTTNFPLMQGDSGMFSRLQQAIDDNAVCMKITVTLYPKAPYNSTPIVSMRTFRVQKAKDWDYNYQPNDGWVMKPLH